MKRKQGLETGQNEDKIANFQISLNIDDRIPPRIKTLIQCKYEEIMELMEPYLYQE